MTTGSYKTMSGTAPDLARASGFGGWLAALWAFACLMVAGYFIIVSGDDRSLTMMFGSAENVVIMRVVLWLNAWLLAPFLILAPLEYRLMPTVTIVTVLVALFGDAYAVIALLDLDANTVVRINAVNVAIAATICSYLLFSKRVAAIRVSAHPVDVRVRHHFSLLVLIAGSITIAIFGAAAETIGDRVSILTAYQFMILLAFVLIIGPLRTLRTGRTTINMHLRRDVAIWAGVAAMLHLVAGTEQSMTMSYVATFVDLGPSGSPDILRQQLFAWGTVVGFAVALLVALLLLLSNDRAIRMLGKRWWKRLHRASYVVLALTAVHAFVFQFLESRSVWLVACAVMWVTVIVIAQASGFVAVRRKRKLRLLRRLHNRQD